jgi:hypothetical protein
MFGVLIASRRMPYVVLAVVALVLVGAHTASYTKIGPIDELQHIDYADKLAHFRFPRFAETVGQRSLAAMACRGFDAKFEVAASCGEASYPPAVFPEGGQSYEALQPPLYYAVVGLPGRALAAVSGTSPVGVTRLFGALWLGAALWLMLSVATRLGAPAWPTVAVLAAVAATEQVVFLHSTATNDATALFTGALCLWAVVHHRSSPRWSAVLVAVGFIAGATKVTNGFGVGVAALFAVSAPWALDNVSVPVGWTRRVRPALQLVAGYVLATVVWQGIFTLTRLQNPSSLALFKRYVPRQLTLHGVLAQIPVYADPFRTIGPLHADLSGPVYVPHLFAGPVPSTVTVLVSVLLLAATFGSWTLLSPAGRTAASALGASTSAVLLAGAPLQYFAVYFVTGAAETQSRYVYSVVPAMAITAALLLRRSAYRSVTAVAMIGVSSIVVVSAWSQLT